VKAAPKGSSSSLTTLLPEEVRAVSDHPPERPPEPSEKPPRTEPELPTQQTLPPETAPVQVSSSEENLTVAKRLQVDERPQDWREELSERVETFRRRRARLQPEVDYAGNLELDFEDPAKPEDHRSIEDVQGIREDRDSVFDLEIGESAVAHVTDDAAREILSLEESGEEMMQLNAAPAEAKGMSLSEPLAESPPMEILVGWPTEIAPVEEEETEGIYLAPLGRRFLAGLTDALVLILGAALFGIIFWRFCGRLSLVPLNIAVLGFVAVILIFAYFAVFTAIASATPGLLWMGCEIRNLRGGHPTVRESFWRALGVLVSLSALMLGFVWACVDSDSLTWHDRMSGTVITEERNAADLADLKAET
jgi:uncharacterized RDD family membrane protein YckC